MSLAVLSDKDIRRVLENLSRDQADEFAHVLKCALHEYSTGTQAVDAGLIHQPERSSIHSSLTGATTLFMPSISPIGHGIKVITVSSPHANPSKATITPTGSVTLFAPDGRPLGFLHAQTLTAFRTALASSCLLTKRATVRTITVFGSGLQAYWHIRLALMLRGHTIRNIYIINRRFSDNAKDILKRFYAVPTDIKRREGWETAQFSVLTPGYAEYTRLQKDHIRAADVIYCCTPSTEELFDASILTSHEGRRKGRLIVAVGSYTSQMRELPKELLRQAVRSQHGHMHFHKHALEGGVVVVDTLDGALKDAGEIIEARLEPKQLVELGELVMIQKMAQEESDALLASQRGSSTSDLSNVTESLDKLDFGMGPASPVAASSSSAMSIAFGSSDSGSHNRASSRSSSRHSSRHRRRSSVGSGIFPRRTSTSSQGSLTFVEPNPKPQRSDRENGRRGSRVDDHLSRWLTTGNVVYKSVGLGLMDLVVGLEIVKLARETGVGTHVEGFS
ncbi:ornithine cyclodeaminase [Xylariomycetidae sp. FL2044]|nr:ornithine cyclodeaminase [Xylariomycetidae sp. FL2044]